MSDAGRVAVVTGAAGGIGRATAAELARRGFRLVLVDRLDEPLEDAARELRGAGATVLTSALDVADAAAQEALAARCRAELGRVDVLVNNAGIVRVGAFAETTARDWRDLFEVNLLGIVVGTRAFLPLLEDSRGHVVNLGSGTSLLPFPGYAAYGSLKVSVLWLTRYLRFELAARGVTASCICPLLVRTGIGASIQARETRQPEWLIDSPERIARQIARAVERRRGLVIGAWTLRAAYALYRLAPWLVHRVFRSESERMLRADATARRPRSRTPSA